MDNDRKSSMNNTNEKERKRKLSLSTIVICVALICVLLFPRIQEIKDGGSIIYESICSGLIYRVEKRHRMTDVNGVGYYEKGTVISIFWIEVYNNSRVDYEDKLPPHSPEVESLSEELAALDSADQSK